MCFCHKVPSVNRRLALLRLAALPGALGLFARAQAQSLPEQPTEPVPSGFHKGDREAISAQPPTEITAPGAPLTPAARSMDELLMRALALVGTRYRPGGSTPESGFDCSGYVAYLFREVFSYDLPRTSDGMVRYGVPVERRALTPGDLVFFNTMHRPYTHVGIYLADDRFLHAPSSGGFVRTEDLNLSYWVRRWNGARRISLA